MAADKSPKKAAAADKPKKLTPYNAFMKTELAKVKKAQPTLSHKEAFKAAAGNVSGLVESVKRAVCSVPS